MTCLSIAPRAQETPWRTSGKETDGAACLGGDGGRKRGCPAQGADSCRAICARAPHRGLHLKGQNSPSPLKANKSKDLQAMCTTLRSIRLPDRDTNMRIQQKGREFLGRSDRLPATLKAKKVQEQWRISQPCYPKVAAPPACRPASGQPPAPGHAIFLPPARAAGWLPNAECPAASP